MLTRTNKLIVLGLLTLLAIAIPIVAQQQRAYTAADYQKAERFMGYNTNPLVLRSGVRPTWLRDDKFWYRITTEKGSEFVAVDPATGNKTSAFNHAALALRRIRYGRRNVPLSRFLQGWSIASGKPRQSSLRGRLG